VRSELRNVLEELLETTEGEELHLRAKKKGSGKSSSPQTGLMDSVNAPQSQNRKNNSK